MTSFAVLDGLEGLITPTVGRVLYALAADVPADRGIVEVGSYKGKSTCYLAAGAQQGGGAHVWAVDAWDLPGNQPGRFRFDLAHTAFREQVDTAGLADRITTVRAFSGDAAAGWDGPPVGLLYIDGSHFYDDVAADYHAWRPHLAAGAKVVFDDYDVTRNPGVNRAVDELIARGALKDLDVSCPPLAVTVAS